MSKRQQNHFIQPSCYDILGVPHSASDMDIKDAYRRLVLEWHPDRQVHDPFLAEHNLKIINEAYSQLKTRAAREQYNHILRLQRKAQKLSNAAAQGQPRNSWGRFWNWLTMLESNSK